MRQIDSERITTEVRILDAALSAGHRLDTRIKTTASPASLVNPVGEEVLGRYRSASSYRSVTADIALIEAFSQATGAVPAFLEAGPRSALAFKPESVRAAIVTTGGIAPGLHSVVHAIAQRHFEIYKLNTAAGGELLGVRDGFLGLCDLDNNSEDLNPKQTAEWLGLGGCKLGARRYYGEEEWGPKGPQRIKAMANVIGKNLRRRHVNILYVLGGDGSMRIAHEVAALVPEVAVVGVPKTMDNDILWVSESFGLATAVEEAARVIGTLHREAESTRRMCVIELFGAESGFVAANSTLASGNVDLVLIPEVFKALLSSSRVACQQYWMLCLDHLRDLVVMRKKTPYAVVVVAEGIATILRDGMVTIQGVGADGVSAGAFVASLLANQVYSSNGRALDVFLNEPRHNIRAVAAGAHDQVYCEQLGALAVDSALAGYTDFLVSKWLGEHVLVPLELVTAGQKGIPLDSMFWRQVTNNTAQPSHEPAIRAAAADLKTPL